jgi:hypothetical protein
MEGALPVEVRSDADIEGDALFFLLRAEDVYP